MGDLYVKGYVPFGSIAQTTIALSAIFGGATILIGQVGGVMAYFATIERVGAIMEAVERTPPPTDNERIELHFGRTVSYDNVTILSPDGQRTLIESLSLEVKRGTSLLVTGEHGVGKTALLRATAGYYLRGNGNVQRPPPRDIMFVTPYPYLPSTTLREGLCYSFSNLCQDDSRLLQALEIAKLPDLYNRCLGLDTVQIWNELLTQSELQRLSLARVILARPEYVAIDDRTNALQSPEQQLFYTQLSANGCTTISSGPPSLTRYHQRTLDLHADGRWELHDLDHSSDR
jgi:putative ATP-binding cassette transporter